MIFGSGKPLKFFEGPKTVKHITDFIQVDVDGGRGVEVTPIRWDGRAATGRSGVVAIARSRGGSVAAGISSVVAGVCIVFRVEVVVGAGRETCEEQNLGNGGGVPHGGLGGSG